MCDSRLSADIESLRILVFCGAKSLRTKIAMSNEPEYVASVCGKMAALRSDAVVASKV